MSGRECPMREVLVQLIALGGKGRREGATVIDGLFPDARSGRQTTAGPGWVPRRDCENGKAPGQSPRPTAATGHAEGLRARCSSRQNRRSAKYACASGPHFGPPTGGSWSPTGLVPSPPVSVRGGADLGHLSRVAQGP
jgi:hypothetical protein